MNALRTSLLLAGGIAVGVVGTLGAQTAAGVSRREPQFENATVKAWKSIIMPKQPLTYHRHDHSRAIIALKGGTAVAMLTAFMPEWHDESARWIDAVLKTAAAESEANRALLRQWVRQWTERAQAALAPVAELALGEAGLVALDEARTQLAARCAKAGVAG